uniref:TAFH domain-containing protein n=1 Tax=Steinernema glaseri TaxID=37863 RepID=A0A1I7Y6V5_9BILA
MLRAADPAAVLSTFSNPIDAQAVLSMFASNQLVCSMDSMSVLIYIFKNNPAAQLPLLNQMLHIPPQLPPYFPIMEQNSGALWNPFQQSFVQQPPFVGITSPVSVPALAAPGVYNGNNGSAFSAPTKLVSTKKDERKRSIRSPASPYKTRVRTAKKAKPVLHQVVRPLPKTAESPAEFPRQAAEEIAPLVEAQAPPTEPAVPLAEPPPPASEHTAPLAELAVASAEPVASVSKVLDIAAPVAVEKAHHHMRMVGRILEFCSNVMSSTHVNSAQLKRVIADCEGPSLAITRKPIHLPPIPVHVFLKPDVKRPNNNVVEGPLSFVSWSFTSRSSSSRGRIKLESNIRYAITIVQEFIANQFQLFR